MEEEIPKLVKYFVTRRSMSTKTVTYFQSVPHVLE